MRGAPRRPGGWRNAVLGGALILAGLVAFFVAPDPLRWQLLGAGAFVGLFLIVVLGPAPLPSQQVGLARSSFENLDRLVRSLRLEGAGVYVAAGAQPTLAQDRVFVAAKAAEPDGIPGLDAATSLYTSGLPGLALDPPGRALLDEHEQLVGQKASAASLGELDVLMGSFLASDRLVKGVTYRRRAAKVTIRFRHAKPNELCRVVRERMPRLAETVGCPTCSAMVLALSRSLHQPVRLDEVREERGEIVLEVTTPR